MWNKGTRVNCNLDGILFLGGGGIWNSKSWTSLCNIYFQRIRLLLSNFCTVYYALNFIDLVCQQAITLWFEKLVTNAVISTTNPVFQMHNYKHTSTIRTLNLVGVIPWVPSMSVLSYLSIILTADLCLLAFTFILAKPIFTVHTIEVPHLIFFTSL